MYAVCYILCGTNCMVHTVCTNSFDSTMTTILEMYFKYTVTSILANIPSSTTTICRLEVEIPLPGLSQGQVRRIFTWFTHI